MRLHVLLLAVLGITAATHAAPPAQDPSLRPELCLNGEWQFQPADPGLSFPPTGTWDPVAIRIPSPWNVNSFSRSDGGDFECFPSYPKAWEEVQAAWHRRTFTLPASMRGKALFLRFEAVHYRADVYVNGRKAGSHEGGFTPFELSITDLVSFDSPNELVVGVKAHQLFNVKGRATYGWGSFWGGHIHGIWQDVSLIARPLLHVSDVFVMTSVERREITLQVSVTNLDRRPRHARINNHVFEAGQPAPGGMPGKGFTRAQVDLAPGETRTLTLAEPWASAKLWWPDDPQLYVLLTRLYADDEDNTPIDMRRTRFGFREFGLDAEGKHFELNGVPWRGRADAWHFMGIPQLTPAYARAWYEMARAANVNLIRLHAQVYPEYYLDVADEMGMLIVDESALWGSAINFWYDEDFLRRAKAHVQELVLRDRNHPSVALWSVANEIYARRGDDNAPDQDWIFARYAELAGEMKKLDPTREVSSDGDGDLNGRLPIYSLHYPGAGDPKKPKACTIGESGGMYHMTPPEVAQWIGDHAYLTSRDRMEALAVQMQDLVPGYRQWAAYATVFNLAWYGLDPLPMEVQFRYDDLGTPGVKPERLGPYSTCLNAGRDPKLPAYEPNPLFTAMKDLYEPIRFFVRERGYSLWEEATVVRHLTVHSDVLEPSALVLSWKLTRGGKQVATGRTELAMQPAESREVEVSFRTPKTVGDEEWPLVKLQLALSREGKVCYQQELTYALWSRPSLAKAGPKTARDLLLYDPSGKTAEVLDWLNCRYTRVASPMELATDRAALCVVGANSGIGPAEALAIDDKARGLAVFEGNPGFYGDGLYCSRHSGTYRRGFLVTVGEGRDEDWQLWGTDGVIARAACGREAHGEIHPEVRCGDGDLVLFEVMKGDRLRVFCELVAIEKAHEEPVAAGTVMASIARFYQESPGWYHRSRPALISAPRSRFAAALQALGVPDNARNPDLLLCDGSTPPTDPEAVRRFIAGSARGDRRIVLCNLTPESLEAWNAVLPVKLSLEPSEAVQLVAEADEGFLTLINHADLYWIEDKSARRIMDFAVSSGDPEARPMLVTNHTDWRRWAFRGENIKTGSLLRSEREPFTRQTGVLTWTGDFGELIVSQVRLDPTNPKSARFYSQMLSDLCVPLRQGVPTGENLAAFNVDADGYLTNWLVCGPFQSERPYDTDFLGGENTIQPERGLFSGACVWRGLRSSTPVLDFAGEDVFGRLDKAAVYAAVTVLAPQARTVDLWLGSDDGVKVWLNGKLVHANPATRPVTPDSDRITGLELRQGENLLVVKVSQGTGEWGLCARFVEPTGKPITNLTVLPAGQTKARQPLPTTGWTATASHSGEDPARAFDGDPATRWTTGTPQVPGMWYRLDLGSVQTLSELVLDSAGSARDYPRGFTLEVSTDGTEWKTLVFCPQATGAQEKGVVTVCFAPTSFRYLRLTQTGSVGGLYWSIHELKLLR